MTGCLQSTYVGIALYALSFFGLHAIAHCQVEGAELPTLVELQSRCAPDVTHRRALLEHEGDAGVWLAEPVASCMLGRLRLLPELRLLVELQSDRIRRSDAQVELLGRQLALSSEIETQLSDALETSERTRARSIRWTRHPGLWFAVGIVVSVALQVVAMRAVDALGSK